MDSKQAVINAVAGLRERLCGISRALWERPEPAWREHFASGLLADELEAHGFRVERGVAGIPTAFVAQWGEGKPRIGLLAEFDALPGFSQQVCAEERPVEPGAPGHGCGHNLMAAAHLGAALAAKAAMEESGVSGTIVFYGCPAEEVLTGKVFMARAGLFDDLDCALNFHPGATNSVSLKSISGLNNVKFNFTGTGSHAALTPHLGRSAADAAELMNVGANYLREHIPAEVRMHYVTPSSGQVPNIVPRTAQTWYYIRARTRADVEHVYERLVEVAKGAAMMTGTRVEVDFQGGCYPSLQNPVLAEVCCKAMKEIPFEAYTEEELDFAAQLNAPYPPMDEYPAGIDGDTVLHQGVLDVFGAGTFAYNSTDVGDVGHIVPTVMISTTCFNARAVLHSWNVAACAGHSIGQKGMLFAAGSLGLAAVRLMERPEEVDAAGAAFRQVVKTPYKCPIPDEVLPPVERTESMA